MIINNQAGIKNLMAYALGANPYTAKFDLLPTSGMASVSDSKYLTLNFKRNTSASDITYTVQGSSDLSTWTTISSYSGGAWTPSANVTDAAGVVTVQDTIPTNLNVRRFMRLQVAH